MMISHDRFSVSDFHEYSMGSPEGKIYSRMFRVYYIPLLKLLVLRVLKDDAE